MDSGVSVLCAVLQGHLQEEGKDGARDLGGLKWKLGKPVCIGEHRGSLSPPATLPWLKAVSQPPQNPYEAAVHRYGVASRLPNNPALSPCCLLLSVVVLLSLASQVLAVWSLETHPAGLEMLRAYHTREVTVGRESGSPGHG